MSNYRLKLLSVMAALLVVLVLAVAPAHAQVSFGSNWFGQFYNQGDLSFTAPIAATATYPTGLNFNWGASPPITGVGAENWSARFTTTEIFAVTGNYEFSGTVDDQIRVYIDGIEVYAQTTPGPFSFIRTLSQGQHTLRVDYLQLTATAFLQFQWQPTTAAPGATAPPAGPVGPVGQVVNVTGLSLRTGPYLGASMIAVLRPDIAYSVNAKNNDEGGGFTWYRVTAGDRVGWASGRYLIVTGGDVPEISTVFQEIDGAPDLGVVAIPRAIMNFRLRPSIRSQRIGQIGWGEEVSLIGRTVQGGENFWFHVRRADGSVGWIYAPYISVRGNIHAVPIR